MFFTKKFKHLYFLDRNTGRQGNIFHDIENGIWFENIQLSFSFKKADIFKKVKFSCSFEFATVGVGPYFSLLFS